MIAAALTLALALQASAPAAKGPAKAAAPAKRVAVPRATASEYAVAEAMQKGFTACALQVTDRKHLAAGNQAALKKAGLTLSDAPPEEVKTVAMQLFKDGSTYAQVASFPAAVWVIGSPTLPACKVTVANTKDAPGARAELDRRFRGAKAWSHDPAASWTRNGLVRQAYILNKDRPGPHMRMLVDGPAAAADEGKGIQTIMTIGFVKPEAK